MWLHTYYLIVIVEGGWGKPMQLAWSHCIDKLHVNTAAFHLHSQVNKLTVIKTAGNIDKQSS